MPKCNIVAAHWSFFCPHNDCMGGKCCLLYLTFSVRVDYCLTVWNQIRLNVFQTVSDTERFILKLILKKSADDKKKLAKLSSMQRVYS